MENIRLCIGIPTNKEYCHYKFFHHFVQMKRPNVCTTFIYDDQPVSKCRNKIVKKAFDWGATHLLMLDDDMTFPDNIVDILLNHNKPIVGALAFKRRPPYLPVIYQENPNYPERMKVDTDYEKGLIEVAATGAACLLVQMEVFRRMRHPWFDFKPDEQFPGEYVGEDIMFCKKAKELGYKIYVDTMHPIGHLGLAEVNENVWLHHRKEKMTLRPNIEFDRIGNEIPAEEKILIE